MSDEMSVWDKRRNLRVYKRLVLETERDFEDLDHGSIFRYSSENNSVLLEDSDGNSRTGDEDE